MFNTNVLSECLWKMSEITYKSYQNNDLLKLQSELYDRNDGYLSMPLPQQP